MFNKLKNRTASFLVNYKYRRTPSNPFDYDSFYSESRYVLLVLPEIEGEVISVLPLIREIILDKKRITLISRLEHKSRLTEFDMFDTIYYTGNDVSRLGLPRKDFIRKIEENPYDIVIDLNTLPGLFSINLTMAVKSRFRVGFHGKVSETMYNFQIKPDKNISANSFRFLLNSLKMF